MLYSIKKAIGKYIFLEYNVIIFISKFYSMYFDSLIIKNKRVNDTNVIHIILFIWKHKET